MTLLLLGEGATDLGENNPYKDPPLQKGAMTLVIDALAAHKGIASVDYKLYTRGDIKAGLKASKRMIGARPKEVDKEMTWYFKAAYYLGKVVEDEKKDGAVFFHDPDHSNAESPRTNLDIEEAMRLGFGIAHCETGVPMVPNPRSEAWLMAYFQKYQPKQREYNKAERFEDRPATDRSPNDVKTLLRVALHCQDAKEVYPRVMEEFDAIDWTKVSMPSYNRFRECLERVLERAKAREGCR